MKWNDTLPAALMTAWFAVMLGGVLVGVYWFFEKSDPPLIDFTLDFQDEHGNTKLDFRVTEKLYSHGVFTVTREFRRTLTRTLINTDTGQIIAVYSPQVEIFKPKQYVRVFPVTPPADLKPANYHYHFLQTYALNPLQPTVPIVAPLQPFRIVQ